MASFTKPNQDNVTGCRPPPLTDNNSVGPAICADVKSPEYCVAPQQDEEVSWNNGISTVDSHRSFAGTCIYLLGCDVNTKGMSVNKQRFLPISQLPLKLTTEISDSLRTISCHRSQVSHRQNRKRRTL